MLNWPDRIPVIEFGLRVTVQRTTGYQGLDSSTRPKRVFRNSIRIRYICIHSNPKGPGFLFIRIRRAQVSYSSESEPPGFLIHSNPSRPGFLFIRIRIARVSYSSESEGPGFLIHSNPSCTLEIRLFQNTRGFGALSAIYWVRRFDISGILEYPPLDLAITAEGTLGQRVGGGTVGPS